MIYIFGEGRELSIVYAPETLTEQDKQGAFIVESLPLQNTPIGYEAYLVKENDTLRWEYEELPEELKEK